MSCGRPRRRGSSSRCGACAARRRGRPLVDLRRLRPGKPLREWEARLPESQFVRIHRSTIVNLEYVERVEEWSHASYRLHLRGLAEPLIMSRRYGVRVRERLG